MVPLSALLPSDSPRLAGESADHVRTLAELGTSLPPIIVHRSTMRVIDGMHRLNAARMKGKHEIEVNFYDGDSNNVFVVAVQANIAHGLPLSLEDRREAASRIMQSHPSWSDRAIAVVTGLEHKAVGAIRSRSSGRAAQSNSRLGRDGRRRPTDPASRRRIASALINDQPQASLREIAKAAGISVSTARDVRERLNAGQSPLPSRQQPQQNVTEGRSDADPTSMLQNLRSDPSLRLTESGRLTLQWLGSGPATSAKWHEIIEKLPPHCIKRVARLARQSGDAWHRFAESLESRGDCEPSKRRKLS
jgi:ParB-like chromosome segregation protein Spo0J